MRFACMLLCCGLLPADNAVEVPAIGYARAADGSIIRVSGIAGAFGATSTDHAGVLAAAFSGQLGVLKLPSSVRMLDASAAVTAEWDAQQGSALFGFNPAGDSVIAYYSATTELNVYAGGGWSTVPLDGTRFNPIAVALKDARHALLLDARERLSLVTLRVSDGAVEDETVVGDGSAPALLAGSGLVFTRGDNLIYRDASGTEQPIAAPGIASLTRMGANWIQAQRDSGGNLALRLAPEPRVFVLPEVAQ